MIARFLVLTCLCVLPVLGQAADVYLLGEIHDNPAHHQQQAQRITDIAPPAVIFEMLDTDQARAISELSVRTPQAIRDVSGWDQSGWPDFDMYAPIFHALNNAAILGAAVPRDQARAAFEQGVVSTFDGDAALFGLDRPLPGAEQTAREAYQLAAHCDALPAEMLPMMVDIQRLRDATLALRITQALQEYGPPVVVITGNGHARRDWGIARYLMHTEWDIFALGQGEGDRPPDGIFDAIVFADPIQRDDPCAAFAKSD